MMKHVYGYIAVLFILIAVCCNNHTRTGKVQTTTQEPYLREDSPIVLSNDEPESKDSICLTDIADSLFYISLKEGGLDVLQLYYFDSLILLSNRRNLYSRSLIFA